MEVKEKNFGINLNNNKIEKRGINPNIKSNSNPQFFKEGINPNKLSTDGNRTAPPPQPKKK